MIRAMYRRFRAASVSAKVEASLVGYGAQEMLQAKWRTTAMLAGPWPVRDRALSSPKVTSSTQSRLFSMARWLRTASAGAFRIIFIRQVAATWQDDALTGR